MAIQLSGSLAITGSLVATGQIIAQTLNVQQVTSSIVYSSGSNIFGNSVSNTQQFTGSLQVSSSTSYILGNVGIGTTSPNTKLEVNGNIYTTSNTNFILFGTNSTVNPYVQGGSDNSLFIGNNNTSRIFISGSGNVGIGTTTPLYLLDVNRSSLGTIAQFITNDGTYNPRLLINGTADGLQLFATYSTLAGALMLGTGGVERMRITGGGDVGIGTTSPNSTLQVRGDNGSSVSAVIRLRDTNSTARTTRLQFEDYNGTLADGLIDFKIPTAGSAVGARLDIGVDSAIISLVRGGNVGIGTTSPDQKLNVEGSDANAVQFKIKNNNVGNGNKYLAMFVGGTTGYSVNGWANSGVIESAAGTSSNLVLSNYEAGPIIFQTNDRNERMRITSGGNVLIGQTVASGNSNGIYFRVGIESGFIVTSDVALQLSRLVTTGDIQTFYSGTTRVGKIAVGSSTVTFESATNGGLSIVSTGYVGIGATNPFSSLDVSTSSTGAICVGNSSTGISSGDLIGAISFVSRDASVYSSGGVSNIRSYATETYNTSNVGADLRFYTTNTVQNINADVLFGTERMRITSGGNVLIGTTTGDGYKLQIVGNSQASSTFGITYSTVAAYSQWVNSSGAFVMGLDAAAGTTERMRITSAGNVGIGTTSPGDKLDVVGGNVKQLSSSADSAAKYCEKIIYTGSNFDNPLVSIYSAGNGTNAVAIIKITVYQTAFGSENANIHVGYAKLMGQNASGTVTSMTVEYNGGIGSVGTLSWSGHTLQYQTNRVSNYDSYTIKVELAGSLGITSF
jgi:hypothetical protein